jgi:enoyl-CoA hydratase
VTRTSEAFVPTVVIDRPSDRVRVIRLDRPERLNALTFGLAAELHDALDEIAADDECRVVVLTGSGRGFCAGLDLRDFGAPPDIGAHPWRTARTSGQAFMSSLARHINETPQMVVAAVNGPAYGGGLALAAACDLRVASASATFCCAFIKTGMTATDIGISWFLPRLVGASRAFDLMVSGRAVDADEAERMGLVSRVLADEGFVPAAIGIAEVIAGYTSYALRATKEVMWANLDCPDLAAALALENRNQELAAVHPEVTAHMARYSRIVQKS